MLPLRTKQSKESLDTTPLTLYNVLIQNRKWKRETKMKKEMKSMKKQQSYAMVPVMLIAAGLAVFMMKAMPVVSSMPMVA